jgi:hypothetical protein
MLMLLLLPMLMTTMQLLAAQELEVGELQALLDEARIQPFL